MNMFATDHEAILYCNDRTAGLKGIIAIHNTRLGPALGGTRIFPYAGEADALQDVLQLSRAMTYKAAAAELPFGGGKAVIIADPSHPGKRAMLKEFCRYLNMLNGNFETGEDLGTTQADILYMRQFTKFAHATELNVPQWLETSALTARGVLSGIEASAKFVFGSADLAGRTVAIQGLGKVGLRLARMLKEKKALLILSDVDETLSAQAAAELQSEAVNPANLFDAACDIFAPCAIGGVINRQTVERLRARIIAGCANNQLADESVGEILRDREILYAPDYVINAGGLISALLEMGIENQAQVLDRVDGIGARLLHLYTTASAENISPLSLINRRVEEKLSSPTIFT